MVNKQIASSRRRLAPEARRLEILEAAERLLQRDAAAVRVDDIVTEAGASKGTFFAYFATWDEMLEAVRERQSRQLEAALADQLTPSAQADWRALLPRLAAIFIDFVIDMRGLHEVLFHSAFAHARPLPSERRPQARIAAILRAGIAAGAYLPVDPQPTASLVFAAIHETADAIISGADRKSSIAALDTVLDRVLFASAHPSENPA